jgi:hypothetical protein
MPMVCGERSRADDVSQDVELAAGAERAGAHGG